MECTGDNCVQTKCENGRCTSQSGNAATGKIDGAVSVVNTSPDAMIARAEAIIEKQQRDQKISAIQKQTTERKTGPDSIFDKTKKK